MNDNQHHEVLTLTLHEESSSGAAIRKIVVNRSIKKGYITLYGLTEENEVKVYEISFFGTAKTSTKLIKRIPNIRDINDVYLYNPLSFDPHPYKD